MYNTFVRLILILVSGAVIAAGFALHGIAQPFVHYNINTNNGLPSNHVYGITVDRFGYMWICTPKGLVRYNGYDLKTFTVKDGLPTDDVWEVLEDKKGRLWLGCVAREVGYIKNDKYNKIPLHRLHGTVYPHAMRQFDSGIIFQSPFQGENNIFNYICYEAKDTLYGQPLIDSGILKRSLLEFAGVNVESVDELGNPVYISGAYNFILKPDRNADRSDFFKNPAIFLSACTPKWSRQYYDYLINVIGHSLIAVCLSCNLDSVVITNILTGKVSVSKIPLKAGDFLHHSIVGKLPVYGNNFYLVSDSGVTVCRCKDSLEIVKHYSLSDLVGNVKYSGTVISAIQDGRFWRSVTGTTVDGLWFNYQPAFHRQVSDFDMTSYKVLGSYKDSLVFWKNSESSHLILTDAGFHQSRTALGVVSQLRKITFLKEDTFLAAATHIYYFTLHDMKFHAVDVRSAETSLINAAIGIGRDSLVALDKIGLCLVRKDEGIHKRIQILADRFDDLVTDSVRSAFWAYSERRAVMTNGISLLADYDNSKLLQMGIDHLRQVEIDRQFGNIFFLGYDNAVLYFPEDAKSVDLFPAMKVGNGAKVLTYGNRLILTWKYGVLFSVIEGPLKLSAPVWLRNEKNVNYRELFDAAVSGGKLVLNTDKGLLTAEIPAAEEIRQKGTYEELTPRYNFIVSVADQRQVVHPGDTLVVD